MIGIVVVSHGQVAGELVNAARNIVGEVPAIAAVSIAWTDDMSAAREKIERALGEVGGGGVLILTDMFGGTPTNVSLPFLSAQVEIVTGVNLPMAHHHDADHGRRPQALTPASGRGGARAPCSPWPRWPGPGHWPS